MLLPKGFPVFPSLADGSFEVLIQTGIFEGHRRRVIIDLLAGTECQCSEAASAWTKDKGVDTSDEVFRGDGWSGFQKIDLRSDSRFTFAACWAHARRKIDECRCAFPVQVAKLDSLIRMLYDVEDQTKDSETRAFYSSLTVSSDTALGLRPNSGSTDLPVNKSVIETAVAFFIPSFSLASCLPRFKMLTR